jgi:DNA-binding transcriptional ArsR family regulator
MSGEVKERSRKQREGTFVIHDLETLKVIADPIRNQILDILQFSPQNTKDVADKLGLAPSKLYYHFNMLEKFGLIKVVETRQVSNLIEKYYLAISNYFCVDPTLLNFESSEGKENINSLVGSTIDTTREDLLRSLHARTLQIEQGAVEKKRSLILTRNLSNLSDEKAEKFVERLSSLLEDFIDADTKDPADQTFAFTAAMYPSFYFRDLSAKKE